MNYQNLVNGEWKDSKNTITIYSPVNGSESIYNIEMIEENKTIIGIGAGAITKLIWLDERKNRDNIKRLVNPKDPLVWMNELPERLVQKKIEIQKLFNK